MAVTPEDLQRWDELTQAALVKTNPMMEQPIGVAMSRAEWVATCALAMPKLIAEVRQLMQERAETAEARLLALQVDRSKAVKLRDETDNVIWALKPADVPGAINWGDLGVREVQEVIDDERRWYRVIIEEADPSNPALHAAVMAGLAALGWNADDIELETAW